MSGDAEEQIVQARIVWRRWATPPYAACVAALGYAALKAYWGAGGTGLLDTVSLTSNDEITANPWFVAFGLWGTAALAVAGVAITLAMVRPWGRAFPRWMLLVPAWFGCTLLVPRGVLGFVSDVLLLTGVKPTYGAGATAADVHRWAYWDLLFYSPLFLVWGVTLAVTAWSYGRRTRRPRE
ncbi:MAG: DUF3995 domain-containing protein [Streptosporangiales bacterium]|nr:DUF3995 domain-containing protein [Streptosporangiales bacterium]